MTTLPQMTSLRLPRAPGAPMAIPAMTVGPAMAPKLSGADVWRVIRGNLWLIVTMVLVMSVLGYVGNEFYLVKYYPRYTASGWVQVQPYIVFDPLRANIPIIESNMAKRTEMMRVIDLLQMARYVIRVVYRVPPAV